MKNPPDEGDPAAARSIAAVRKAPRMTGKGEPGWAKGLRDLYDSVVDEDVPDSFADLLRKLDDASGA